ncbi:hypothetical protein MKX57_10935 [Lysinibacillus sp. FSL M8-0216]|uniref:hypothetical protein n=1 Tax=Lysinibacillus sp. FSL M8-0216 TaxID=2921619 RepID=UPI00315A4D01
MIRGVHLEKASIIEQLEDYVCDNKQDNRVVSVEIDKHIDNIINSNYVVTNITIRAMNDDIAHTLDSLKWRDGNLVEHLERELKKVSEHG